jgi:hypothetical protein
MSMALVRSSLMSLPGSAVALAVTLTTAFILCFVAAAILPATWVKAPHGWLALWSSAPPLTAGALLQGVIASLITGGFLGLVFAWTYNRTAGR